MQLLIIREYKYLPHWGADYMFSLFLLDLLLALFCPFKVQGSLFVTYSIIQDIISSEM